MKTLKFEVELGIECIHLGGISEQGEHKLIGHCERCIVKVNEFMLY